MTRAQVERLVPLLDMSPTARFPIHGGLIQRRGGTARHDAVAWGYARAADRLGVDVIQNCEVTGFAMTGGRITGVETTRGGIGADRVGICVAGNSGPVAALAGIRLPIEAQTLQAFVTEPVKPMIDTVIMSQSLHCYISQSDKGGIVLGGDPDQFPSYAQRGLPTRIEKAAARGDRLGARAVPAAHGALLVGNDRHELRWIADHLGDSRSRSSISTAAGATAGSRRRPDRAGCYAHTAGDRRAASARGALRSRPLRGGCDDRRGGRRLHAAD